MKRNIFLPYWVLLLSIIVSCIRKGDTFDGVNGEKRNYFKNGKVKSIKTYREGMLNGPFVEYFSNGKIHNEFEYKDNYKDGAFKEYYENGNMKSLFFYKEGDKDSICKEFYLDGKVKREENYKGGKLEGATKVYFESGKLNYELSYALGKKHGIQKYYYESGQLKAITDFFDGRPGLHLEEYTPEGNRIIHDLKIQVKEIDKLSFDNEYIYLFKLNKSSEDDKFYMGDLEKGKYFPISRYELNKKDGYFIKPFYVPKYAFLMDKLTFIAITKTKFGNDLILTKQVNVAINHYN